MAPLLLAVAIANAPACPTDLVVVDPRRKVVRTVGSDADEVITVDVVNRGRVTQTLGVRQHLDLLVAGQVAGSQAMPALGSNQHYVVAFRIRVPRDGAPHTVTFRYVLDSGDQPRNDCDGSNNLLTTAL